jgi:hypothetical protein
VATLFRQAEAPAGHCIVYIMTTSSAASALRGATPPIEVGSHYGDAVGIETRRCQQHWFSPWFGEDGAAASLAPDGRAGTNINHTRFTSTDDTGGLDGTAPDTDLHPPQHHGWEVGPNDRDYLLGEVQHYRWPANTEVVPSLSRYARYSFGALSARAIIQV